VILDETINLIEVFSYSTGEVATDGKYAWHWEIRYIHKAWYVIGPDAPQQRNNGNGGGGEKRQ